MRLACLWLPMTSEFRRIFLHRWSIRAWRCKHCSMVSSLLSPFKLLAHILWIFSINTKFKGCNTDTVSPNKPPSGLMRSVKACRTLPTKLAAFWLRSRIWSTCRKRKAPALQPLGKTSKEKTTKKLNQLFGPGHPLRWFRHAQWLCQPRRMYWKGWSSWIKSRNFTQKAYSMSRRNLSSWPLFAIESTSNEFIFSWNSQLSERVTRAIILVFGYFDELLGPRLVTCDAALSHIQVESWSKTKMTQNYQNQKPTDL